MARKKATTTKALVKKVGLSNELTVPGGFEEEFQKYIDRDAASAKSAGWSYLSTKGAQFRFGGQPIGSDIEVVILGAMRENTYFTGEYSPDNPQGPDCFALDLLQDENTMSPPAELESRQSDKCSTCPKNAWGSSDRGRGKACKNTVRLVLLEWMDGDLAVLDKREGARLRIPVTSVKDWAAYAKTFKSINRPLFSAVTSIHLESDPKTMMRMSFKPKGFVNDTAALEIFKRRADEAYEHLTQVQMPNPDDDRQKTTEASRGAGKTKGLVRKRVKRTAASR